MTLIKPVIIMICMVALLAACSQPKQSGSGLDLKTCDTNGLQAECGKLKVFEDRLSKTGRTIDINVTVVRAAGQPVQPDPLFYFAGGPGGAGAPLYGNATGMFAEIHRNRDIIFFDQRGAGQSNEMLCPAPGADEESAAYIRRCLEALPGDPRFYTTVIAMDDVDDIRQALGYDEINLYGISYGVTAAQVYMNRHPEHVRTAILDHGTLLQISFNNVMARDSQLILDRLFTDCQADSACSAAYPRLQEDFAALLKKLEQPVKTNQFDPNNSQPVTFTRETFDSTIHNLLRARDRLALLPGLIHSAAQGNWDSLASKYAQLTYQSSALGFNMMAQMIWCYEDWAIGTPAEIARLGQDSYYLPNALQSQKISDEYCKFIPDPGESAHHGPALPAQIPVLLFSGDYDPQNPPENVSGYQELWPDSLDVVQRGVSHESPPNPCWNSIMAAFVQSGTTRALPLDCVETFSPPAFK